jgi:sugar phosphate isomerase/epimerase
MVADFRECAAFGREHGVVVGLQQHNDFLKTAAETIRVMEAVGSDWFGCILDIGSPRSGDPYAEIEKLVPYAVSWQIKENVGREGKDEPTDLAKIKAIIDRSGYRGYVPFEALGRAIRAREWRGFWRRFGRHLRSIFSTLGAHGKLRASR